MRAKLADAYAVAGDDAEKAARVLRVSLGSARLAKTWISIPQPLVLARTPRREPWAAIYFEQRYGRSRAANVTGRAAAFTRRRNRWLHREVVTVA